jgi:hypothetical protein
VVEAEDEGCARSRWRIVRQRSRGRCNGEQIRRCSRRRTRGRPLVLASHCQAVAAECWAPWLRFGALHLESLWLQAMATRPFEASPRSGLRQRPPCSRRGAMQSMDGSLMQRVWLCSGSHGISSLVHVASRIAKKQ